MYYINVLGILLQISFASTALTSKSSDFSQIYNNSKTMASQGCFDYFSVIDVYVFNKIFFLNNKSALQFLLISNTICTSQLK